MAFPGEVYDTENASFSNPASPVEGLGRPWDSQDVVAMLPSGQPQLSSLKAEELSLEAVTGLLDSTIRMRDLVGRLSGSRDTIPLRNQSSEVITRLEHLLVKPDFQAGSAGTELLSVLRVLTQFNEMLVRIYQSRQDKEERRVGNRSRIRSQIHALTWAPHFQRKGDLSTKDENLLKSHLELTRPLMSLIGLVIYSQHEQEELLATSLQHKEISSRHDIYSRGIAASYHKGRRFMSSASTTSLVSCVDETISKVSSGHSADLDVFHASKHGLTMNNSRVHEKYKQARTLHTYEWFLQSREYHDWRDSMDNGNPGTLWCIGKAGIGKSTIFSKVLDEVHYGGIPYAYFYLGCGNRAHSASEITISLIQQLCEKVEMNPYTLSTYREFADPNVSPSLETLLGCLQDLSEIKNLGRTVVLLDAWDTSSMTDPDNFGILLDGLAKLPWWPFITSRSIDLSIFQFRYGDSLFQIGAEHTMDDNRCYVDGQITNNVRTQRLLSKLKDPVEPLSVPRPDDDKVQERIVEDIVSRSEGLFLWCKLQTVWILGQRNTRQLKMAINTHILPRSQLIDNLLDLIELQSDQMRSTGIRTLIWLAAATMPMSVDGLCEALALQPPSGVEVELASLKDELIPTSDDVVGCCKGLVALDEVSPTLHLVDGEISERLSVHWTEHYSKEKVGLAQACLTYLAFDPSYDGVCDSSELMAVRLRKHPFLRYAANCWMKHARDSQTETNDLVVEFLCIDSHREAALQIYLLEEVPSSHDFRRAREIAQSMSALQVATKFRLDFCVKSLLKAGGKDNPLAVDTEGRTSLHEAMETGNNTIFILLFNKALSEYSKLIQMDPSPRTPFPNDMIDKDRVKLFSYYLLHTPGVRSLSAALKRQDVAALVAHLSLTGLGVPPENVESSPLHLAIRKRSLTLTAALLQFGAEKTLRPGFEPPLFTAIASGGKSMIELLCLYGADVNERRGGWTPIFEAIEKKNIKITRQLLKMGADVNAVTNDGRGVLHIAAATRSTELVEVLLTFGADISHCDAENKTALFTAVKNDDRRMAALLLEYGVDPNAKCLTAGQTALHDAAQGGSKEMVMLLFDHCGSVGNDIRNNAGLTPLDQAKLGSREEVVHILEQEVL